MHAPLWFLKVQELIKKMVIYLSDFPDFRTVKTKNLNSPPVYCVRLTALAFRR